MTKSVTEAVEKNKDMRVGKDGCELMQGNRCFIFFNCPALVHCHAGFFSSAVVERLA